MRIEEQSEVHYDMPVRVMEYDTAEYGRRIREKKNCTEKRKICADQNFYLVFAEGPAAANHNTGTLFPENSGTGARSLHELLDFTEWTDHLRR